MGSREAAGVCKLVCVVLVAAAALSATSSSGDKKTGPRSQL